MKVKIKKIREAAILPEYQTELAAGFDFHACLDQSHTLKSSERYAVPTGLAIEIPAGHVLYVHARSGLALKHGITMANGVGVVDADYRGEIFVLLYNASDANFVIEPNMRVAQGIISKHETAEWIETGDLAETTRGSGGFGSTGR